MKLKKKINKKKQSQLIGVTHQTCDSYNESEMTQ